MRQERLAEARSHWQDAINQFEKTLEIDSENVTAHHNLQLLYTELGQPERAAEHGRLHAVYKVDDNAQGRAVRLARQKYPAANHAAEAVVKYPLQRKEAPELPAEAWLPKALPAGADSTVSALGPVDGTTTDSIGTEKSQIDNRNTDTTGGGGQ